MPETPRQKGNRFQLYIKQWLEKHGWQVRNFPSEAKAIRVKDKKTKEIKIVFVPRKQDFWGADLVARLEDEVKDSVRLIRIQGSLSPNIQTRVDEFKKHFSRLMEKEELQIWIKTGPGKINIKRVLLNSKEQTEDIGKIIRGKFYKEGELK